MPNAKCGIDAQGAYLAQPLDLSEQTADKNGNVAWTFHVPKDYKANKLPIVITSTSSINGHKNMIITSVEVKQFTAQK